MTTATATTDRDGRVITYAWLVLSAITVASWWLAPDHAGVATTSVSISIAVIALGLIKSRMIVRYFMEVRTAPRWLRLATDGWLAALWLGVLVIYLY